MTQEPKIPTWQEFLTHTRQELRYLAEEFLFDEVRTDPVYFQVEFSNRTTRVRAAGYSYGHAFALEFGPVGEDDWWSLRALLAVRAIQLPEAFRHVSQLELVSRQAREFRRFASDVLTGDFSCVPALRDDRDRIRREGLEQQRRDHYERVVAAAARAFAIHDYVEFLRLVTPLESTWTKALELKVEIARKWLG